MTWGAFLALRAWARHVAATEQADVYLVGSALSTIPPRDVDVAIVLPRAAFERRFGPLPDTDDAHDDAHKRIWAETHKAKVQHYSDAQEAVVWAVHVDIRFTPDCWWADHDRVLIAARLGVPAASLSDDGEDRA